MQIKFYNMAQNHMHQNFSKNWARQNTFQIYHCLEILAYDSMTNLLGAGIDEKGFQTDQKLRNSSKKKVEK